LRFGRADQNSATEESCLLKLFSLLNFPLRRRLEELRPRLYRLAYSWCHDAALADDLAQDALIKALARSEQLRDAQALESWLFSILNNCWRDHLRARREFTDVDDLDDAIVDDAPSPEQRYASRQTIQRVRLAIAGLPLGQRQVVTLVDIEECGYAEVAAILGVPVGTVMSRLARARLALRRHFMTEQTQSERPITADRAAIRRVK
jgi:RNA polymerase sigma-70 factor (ECF subfamily)